MLRELLLENFVLMKEAELRPCGGFTVITGDTGAGKSLIVKAFKLIAGARADSRLVGGHGKTAKVQAVFDADERIRAFLDERGIECQDELVIRRVVAADGRGQIFINSARSTLGDLRALSSLLVCLSGQHEFHRLMDRDAQLEWLDEYAGISTSALSQVLSEARSLKRQLDALKEKGSALRQKRQELMEEAEAIDSVAPRPGEDSALEEELKVLRQTERIRAAGQELYQRLYGDRHGIVDGLVECRRLAEKMAAMDGRLEELASRVESLSIEADDISVSLRDYLFDLPVDDARLRQVEERLFRLRGLLRRFGPTLEDVLEHRRTIDSRLAELEDTRHQARGLEDRLFQLERKAVEQAKRLSADRIAAASRFEEAVNGQLRQLNLPRARFEIRIEAPSQPALDHLGPSGMDRIAFLFSANPGQPLRPLSEVASGGELSRILLAIKVVMGGRAGSETLVFDEIDSGLGGEVAEKVGRKLRSISVTTQVIAITHFPQIAALADCHVTVEKRLSESSTCSVLAQVEGRDRIMEIARMLGGDTGKAKEYAEELLGTVLRGA